MDGVEYLQEEIEAREALHKLALKYASLGHNDAARSVADCQGRILARAYIRKAAKERR